MYEVLVVRYIQDHRLRRSSPTSPTTVTGDRRRAEHQGVNALTVGLAEALTGAQVAVDVSNSPITDSGPAVDFFAAHFAVTSCNAAGGERAGPLRRAVPVDGAGAAHDSGC